MTVKVHRCSQRRTESDDKRNVKSHKFHLGSLPWAFNRQWVHKKVLVALPFAATLFWSRDPARSKQLSTVEIHGVSFGLYHVVVPVSINQPCQWSLGLVASLLFFHSKFFDRAKAPRAKRDVYNDLRRIWERQWCHSSFVCLVSHTIRVTDFRFSISGLCV